MASYQAEFTADHGFLGLQHGQTVNVHKYEGDRHAIIGLATIDGPFQDGIWDFIKIKAERFGRVAVSVAYLSNGAWRRGDGVPEIVESETFHPGNLDEKIPEDELMTTAYTRLRTAIVAGAEHNHVYVLVDWEDSKE